MKSKKGAVGAGDADTAAAAAEVLAAGGNAFDAAIAALLAATQAEPVLSSLGGGGFLLARPSGSDAVLYDFFAHTPNTNKANDSDLRPVVADFGTVQQEFHIGQGSIATPGVVKGIFSVHDDLGKMPLNEIAQPAMALARNGVKLSPLQAYIFEIVGPIYRSSKSCMSLYASPKNNEQLAGVDEEIKNPDFADFLDNLVREGEDLFYRGEVAQKIVDDCENMGGHLAMDDFENYSVYRREPLRVSYGDATLLTNPAPSTGGTLIAFALKLLENTGLAKGGFGTPEHISTLARVMGLTNQARIESGLGQDDSAVQKLLDGDFIETYRKQIMNVPKSYRGTTHISVVDAKGNAAALTVSNGEGSGYIAPGTGTVLNNMLGEEDINPMGFGNWPLDTRMSSMMSPSILLRGDGREYAMGSGGSNRIRTAVLQMVLALQDFGAPLADAVSLPRIHYEGDMLNIEPGFSDETIKAMQGEYANCKLWDELNLFFGGVHGVMFDAKKGTLEGAGDPRRGGAVSVV